MQEPLQSTGPTVYKPLQRFFKSDVNSFEKHNLADWVGKTLPPKALVRVQALGVSHKLVDVGGLTLVSYQHGAEPSMVVSE